MNTTTPPPAVTARGAERSFRWTVCALLFFATTINYIDRQILSLLKPVLDARLGWTNQQFGEVMSAFQGAYAVGLFCFGWIIDRFGVRVGYAWSIAAWSLAALGHALVGSISGFLLARVALGLGEGGNFPAAIKAVAVWFPKHERALATSLFNAGANVGAIIAPATVMVLAVSFGWRAAFVGAGVAGLIWLLFWLWLYRVPESESARVRGESLDPEPEVDAGKVPWRQILSHRQAWSFVTAKFLTDPIWWFFLIWIPDFFNQTRHLDLKSSWVYLASIYSLVTLLSVAGGWLTGWLNGLGWSVTRSRKTGMLLFAFCALPILLVTRASDWGAVVLIGVCAGAHQAWSATIYTTVSDMFPKRAVASLVGLGGVAGSVGGILFPSYTGWLLDRAKAAHDLSGGYALLFAICASAYLVAFVLNHLLAPSFAPIPMHAPSSFGEKLD